jgi:hypothetical protein
VTPIQKRKMGDSMNTKQFTKIIISENMYAQECAVSHIEIFNEYENYLTLRHNSKKSFNYNDTEFEFDLYRYYPIEIHIHDWEHHSLPKEKREIKKIIKYLKKNAIITSINIRQKPHTHASTAPVVITIIDKKSPTFRCEFNFIMKLETIEKAIGVKINDDYCI